MMETGRFTSMKSEITGGDFLNETVREAEQIKFQTSVQDLTDFYTESTQALKAPWVIPSNNKFKIAWDLWIMFVLLFTTAIIPLRLAFIEEEVRSWNIFFYAIDGLFAVDIVLWFFTSYVDTQHVEVVSHKKIAKNYLKSWFIIDLVSILPIDVMLSGGGVNKLFRLVRIGKMYKLIRLFRLIKILKLIKSNKKMMS